MATLLTIGDFSRMTHLSVKALRHYHDVGVLEPAAIDAFTGYRSYDAGQVPAAQVIRRLRDLGMPLDGIRTVLAAPDVATRNAEIAEHLARMERQLAQTQASVASLRALLSGPAPHTAVDYRTIPSVTALAVTEIVTAEGFMEWVTGVLEELTGALAAAGTQAPGPFGALYPGDFFEQERAEVTFFAPVPDTVSRQWRPGRARLAEIPAVDAAVAVHEGSLADVDRAYAALGTAVAERAIGVDGPIREYYLISAVDTDDEARHRTEVCWPVFRTIS
jgi:DNA-binding transcriptional MerR regulator